jgi:hypothetical protein
MLRSLWAVALAIPVMCVGLAPTEAKAQRWYGDGYYHYRYPGHRHYRHHRPWYGYTYRYPGYRYRYYDPWYRYGYDRPYYRRGYSVYTPWGGFQYYRR